MKSNIILKVFCITCFSLFQNAKAESSDSLYCAIIRKVTNPYLINKFDDIILPIKVKSDSGKYVVFISYFDLKIVFDSIYKIRTELLDSILYECKYLTIKKELLIRPYSPFREFYVGDTLRMINIH